MKKLLILLAATLLIAASVFAQDEPAPPEFSVTSGIYPSTVYLELSGEGTIYYTTDGSIPTVSSNRYEGPIAIDSTSTELRVGGGWFGEPAEMVNVPSGTVIRAAVISGTESSEVVSHIYFIGEGVQEYFGGIPMINLTLTPYDLWDPENGIYSNYEYEHKVPATFQYFDLGGNAAINRTTDVKVSGHGSRSAQKKSLRIYFKNTDPDQGKYLDYDLIPGNTDIAGNEITRYSKVTLRISDWQYTNLRDVVAQKIGESTRADTAASVPTAVFLNGEYWGMYECREQYDEDYVASHYGIDNDDVVFLDRGWTTEAQNEALPETGTVYTDRIEYSSGPKDGNAKGRLGESYYLEQWRYVQSLCLEKDITDPDVYAEFCANVDIDSFIDFNIVYIFAGNDDWPGNNFKFWRVAEEAIDPDVYGADGKWRFMVHDFDIAFEDPGHKALYYSALSKAGIDEPRHPAFAATLLGGLLKNPDFRSEFAQRTMVYLSSSMSEEGIKKIVDGLVSQREASKTADLLRWGWGPMEMRMDMWKQNTGSYTWFAAERAGRLSQQYTEILNNNFGASISGQATLTLLDNPNLYGYDISYSVNGAELGWGWDKSYSVFAGIPVTITARSSDPDMSVGIWAYQGDSKSYGINSLTFIPQAGQEYVISTVGIGSVYDNSVITPLGIARSDRFAKMTVGEELPAILFDNNGNRLPAEFTVQGDCITVDNGKVKAVAAGRGVLTAKYQGLLFSVTVEVK